MVGWVEGRPASRPKRQIVYTSQKNLQTLVIENLTNG